ncbi:MAG: sigma-70 family RNA polymerase sigma factor [Planctomycetaceae bacterium]|nr:sigma-70 family RNA polymerase sigma factor [Planctomycetaceae bacterium]
MTSESPDDSTAISLLDAVWADSPAGWRRLIRVYTPFVYRYCRASGLSADDSADVGQEVFSAVARKISSFHRDDDHDSFRAWLFKVTRNKIIDHFRNSRRNDFVSMEQVQHRLTVVDAAQSQGSCDEAGPPFSPAVSRAIRDVRSEFEDKTWLAFWHTAVDGQKSADVAESLGMSVNAVYLARSRILRCLRERIERVLNSC